ncbi:hypothetical protein MOTE_23740 [Moorella thermoacetica]|uniref:Transposase, Mutator family n=1 Tax=Neomoorella thermoacetica TaxID=1525 RepID=A0A1J5NAL0_NEOTH|nr:hypothetical protein MOTE_23740 [Moorella thermoacetica]
MVRTFSKEQLRAFIKENNLVTVQEAQEAVKALFGQLIEEMLEAELDHELGYSRYDYRNKKTDNMMNGHTKKRLNLNLVLWRSRFPGTVKVNLSL